GKIYIRKDISRSRQRQISKIYIIYLIVLHIKINIIAEIGISSIKISAVGQEFNCSLIKIECTGKCGIFTAKIKNSALFFIDISCTLNPAQDIVCACTQKVYYAG